MRGDGGGIVAGDLGKVCVNAGGGQWARCGCVVGDMQWCSVVVSVRGRTRLGLNGA